MAFKKVLEGLVANFTRGCVGDAVGVCNRLSAKSNVQQICYTMCYTQSILYSAEL